MRSQVTGLSSLKHLLSPASLRTYAIASLIAKATDAPKNNGGSPTPCKCKIIDFKYIANKLSSHKICDKLLNVFLASYILNVQYHVVT